MTIYMLRKENGDLSRKILGFFQSIEGAQAAAQEVALAHELKWRENGWQKGNRWAPVYGDGQYTIDEVLVLP